MSRPPPHYHSHQHAPPPHPPPPSNIRRLAPPPVTDQAPDLPPAGNPLMLSFKHSCSKRSGVSSCLFEFKKLDEYTVHLQQDQLHQVSSVRVRDDFGNSMGSFPDPVTGIWSCELCREYTNLSKISRITSTGRDKCITDPCTEAGRTHYRAAGGTWLRVEWFIPVEDGQIARVSGPNEAEVAARALVDLNRAQDPPPPPSSLPTRPLNSSPSKPSTQPDLQTPPLNRSYSSTSLSSSQHEQPPSNSLLLSTSSSRVNPFDSRSSHQQQHQQHRPPLSHASSSSSLSHHSSVGPFQYNSPPLPRSSSSQSRQSRISIGNLSSPSSSHLTNVQHTPLANPPVQPSFARPPTFPTSSSLHHSSSDSALQHPHLGRVPGPTIPPSSSYDPRAPETPTGRGAGASPGTQPIERASDWREQIGGGSSSSSSSSLGGLGRKNVWKGQQEVGGSSGVSGAGRGIGGGGGEAWRGGEGPGGALERSSSSSSSSRPLAFDASTSQTQPSSSSHASTAVAYTKHQMSAGNSPDNPVPTSKPKMDEGEVKGKGKAKEREGGAMGKQ